MAFFKTDFKQPTPLRQRIIDAYRMDETACVNHLLESLAITEKLEHQVADLATQLIQNVRQKKNKKTGVEALMVHYDLSTEEGILLMCLAEALLRIPDKETENLLIKDKLTSASWSEHIGRSESSFVNKATWGLALTGKVLTPSESGGFIRIWKNLITRVGEPVIRQAVRETIKLMSEHFVIGRDIKEALNRSNELKEKGYVFSYDMLGEAARTMHDADIYFDAYQDAIQSVSPMADAENIMHGPSISIKLSALYPRYEFSHQEHAVPFLTERLKYLCTLAKKGGISVTIDAEEADRLDMSLDIFTNIFTDHDFAGWEGLGLAVQAYQKRAYFVLQYLIDLARTHKKSIPIRLVKGAYWDSEIKISQVQGFEGYPVFTRKASTDVSYLACAKLLLDATDIIYPQFATHNAYTVSSILTYMDDPSQYDFESQNLQGMGKPLHDQLVKRGILCRIYAPVGSHQDLLPYLVRRLLENGANSSFVNQIADPNTPIEKLIESPVVATQALTFIPHDKIRLPKNLYGEARLNSSGFDISNISQLNALSDAVDNAWKKEWTATPFLEKPAKKVEWQFSFNPANHEEVVGRIVEATKEDVDTAYMKATAAYEFWDRFGPVERATIIAKVSDLLEQHMGELIALTIKEAGKTLSNAINEVREAVDFCRYYSLQAKTVLKPVELPGPTGETNQLRMHGRGVMVCISPWNFPIAIFCGQIAAALCAGNAVIAKPAEQTSLIAARVIELFYEAGVPRDVLVFLPGRGETVGKALIEDPRVGGVIFTGSTETAKIIQKSLVNHPMVIPLIAETGGINALIADSTALPEQLVMDVIQSAFDSAGQRCSALRVLFIQEDIADRVIEMLKGAMAELNLGNPAYLATDIGPVIDKDAQAVLEAHIAHMMQTAKLIYRVQIEEDENLVQGSFVAPVAFELENLNDLKKEVFGPVLHVVRYKRKDLDNVIDQINALGYGLTFGIESRIEETVDYIQSRIKVGNIYVNRNIVGAVVGVQPFGGSRLSGTGPKAGGPHYLPRMCTETTLTINTTAAGGNASLMELG